MLLTPTQNRHPYALAQGALHSTLFAHLEVTVQKSQIETVLLFFSAVGVLVWRASKTMCIIQKVKQKTSTYF
jgi:hypothetical protein